MLSLGDAQANFIATINDGPGTLLPELFAGAPERILLGLKAHANTISHARLVALEDSFPLTRMSMGEAEFSAACRSYCETGLPRSAGLDQIGSGFAAFLRESGVPSASIDLAKIEWAYLGSYHAADARPMSLTDMGAIEASAMLDLRVDVHPAAKLIWLNTASFDLIPELGVVHRGAVLITRPEADVVLNAISRKTAFLFEEALQGCKICNLLELAVEDDDEEAALAAVIMLISAGALVQTG